MIQLILDGQQAVIKDNTTIKFTAGNPYFTKSDSYTFDVELPLAVEANRRIFGWLQRKDVPKAERVLQARLIVDNVTLLTGKAHITAVTDAAVKIQLLGEASAYNFGNKMDQTYIDELDLGDWFRTTWPDLSHWREGYGELNQWAFWAPDTVFRGTTDIVLKRAAADEAVTHTPDGVNFNGQLLLQRLFSGDYPWVAYPTYNSSAGVVCNQIAYRNDSAKGLNFTPYFKGVDGPEYADETIGISCMAIQPYVWLMAEKIARATGFTLDKADNALYSDPLFSKIFIASVHNSIECRKCLPHWSVNEWWEQIERAFGVVLSIDYAGGRMSLHKRAEHYTADAGAVTIDRIADEYTVELSDDTAADLSTGNVGFADCDLPGTDMLPEDVLTRARFNDDFATVYDLWIWARQHNMIDYKDTVFRLADGRHFIYSTARNRLEEVDMLRPRLRRPTTDDIDVELKIVPAHFEQHDLTAYAYRAESLSGDPIFKSFAAPATMIAVEGLENMEWYKEGVGDKIDIEAIISADDTADSDTSTSAGSDLMYIAIASLQKWDEVPVTVVPNVTLAEITVAYPRARVRSQTVIPLSLSDAPVQLDGNESLSLIPVEGRLSLASQTVTGAPQIGAAVRHCIKFIADRIPDPGAVFLIHNRRYVCERIEANLRPQGLDKLLTGYFYQLDM